MACLRGVVCVYVCARISDSFTFMCCAAPGCTSCSVYNSLSRYACYKAALFTNQFQLDLHCAT